MIFYEGGKRRNGETAVCQECKSEFVRRKSHSNGKKIFCSHACSSVAKANRVAVSCKTCKADLARSPSRIKASKSGFFFCNQECMSVAQRIDSGLVELHPSHYGTGYSGYKAAAFRNNQPVCVDCGLSFLPMLVVHHIDGDRKNGDSDNLEILCHNHHALRHMKLADGLWTYNPSSLTPRALLQEVRRLMGFLMFEGLSFNGRTEPWHGSNESSTLSSSTSLDVAR